MELVKLSNQTRKNVESQNMSQRCKRCTNYKFNRNTKTIFKRPEAPPPLRGRAVGMRAKHLAGVRKSGGKARDYVAGSHRPKNSQRPIHAAKTVRETQREKA